MCRELKREPSWVAAIRLAFLRGRVDVESVVEEANLVPGKERTVRDVLETMARRASSRRPTPTARTFLVPCSSSPTGTI